jgi:hypothetical protein
LETFAPLIDGAMMDFRGMVVVMQFGATRSVPANDARHRKQSLETV